MLISVDDTFQNQNYEQCGFPIPEISCDADTECIINCDSNEDDCNGMTSQLVGIVVCNINTSWTYFIRCFCLYIQVK